MRLLLLLLLLLLLRVLYRLLWHSRSSRSRNVFWETLEHLLEDVEDLEHGD